MANLLLQYISTATIATFSPPPTSFCNWNPIPWSSRIQGCSGLLVHRNHFKNSQAVFHFFSNFSVKVLSIPFVTLVLANRLIPLDYFFYLCVSGIPVFITISFHTWQWDSNLSFFFFSTTFVRFSQRDLLSCYIKPLISLFFLCYVNFTHGTIKCLSFLYVQPFNLWWP